MIKILFSTLIFLPMFLFSQNLKINYKIGGYGFGEKGEYEREEIINIYPIKENFRLNYLQLKKSSVFNDVTGKNDRSETDTIEIKNQNLNKNHVGELFSELNQNKNNFNYKFISQNLDKKISKSLIIKTAKKCNIFYFIGDDDSDRIDEFGRKKIREIKKLKQFEKFIDSIKPNLEEFFVHTDTWNSARIITQTKNYKLDFLNVLGQPITERNERFINLNVNLALLNILPKNSLLRKKLSFESLYEDYIFWYLKNYREF
ncbi:hypothetical protein [Halpernia sp. GG3]